MTMFTDPPVTSGVGALLILTDHAGFGNPGTFGGPIRTPALDRLAAGGLNYKRLPRDGDVQSDAGGVNDRAKPSRSALRHGQRIPGAVPGYSAMPPKDRQPFVKTLQEMAIRQPVLASGTRHLTTCRALAGGRRWPDALGFDYFRDFPGGERDHKPLLDAVASGRITAEPLYARSGTVALVGELSGHVFPNLTPM
jgi:hypothetical protein